MNLSVFVLSCSPFLPQFCIYVYWYFHEEGSSTLLILKENLHQYLGVESVLNSYHIQNQSIDS